MDYFDSLPEFLQKKYKQLKKHPKLNDKNDEITDFLVLLRKIWHISDETYQEHVWVRRKGADKIVDSYDDTTMDFLEDAETVINARNAGTVKMTDKQYEMLKKLYDMVEEFDLSLPYPSFSDRDKEIIKDSKWPKIRDYAKLVYKELTK